MSENADSIEETENHHFSCEPQERSDGGAPLAIEPQAYQGVGEEEGLLVPPLARTGKMPRKGQHRLCFEDVDMVGVPPLLNQEELLSLDGIPASTHGEARALASRPAAADPALL